LLARSLSSLLYDVSPADPATFIAMPLVLAASALAACFLPARRASKIDPVEAIRYE
jgi:putative ABC transport system permease protein